MSSETAKLLEDALKLSPQERATLADSLFASLEPEWSEVLDPSWEEAIRNRLRRIAEGKATWLIWDDARQRMFGVPLQPLDS